MDFYKKYQEIIADYNRERLKQGSRQLLESLKELISPLHQWWEKETTRTEIEIEILDQFFNVIPIPPYSEDDAQKYAAQICQYIWQRSEAGAFPVGTGA